MEVYMFGDIYNLKNRIKSIDNDLEMHYSGNGVYHIEHKNSHFMTITRDEMNPGLINKVREIVYKNNNADVLAEIEANNQKLEKSKQKDMENFNESFAKEVKPLVKRIADFG
jgi:hypothetical protein